MLRGLGAVNCQCWPNANLFVQQWFGDCIYTTWELVAFTLGLTSIMMWVVAQMPQLIINFKNQSAEALSPWLLSLWLVADCFSFLGCLLTGDQLPTETFSACYFILSDTAITSQFIYYNTRVKETLDLEEDSEQESEKLICKQMITDCHESPKTDETDIRKFESIDHYSLRVQKAGETADVNYDAGQHTGRPCLDDHSTIVIGSSGAAMIARATQSARSVDDSDNVITDGSSSGIAFESGQHRSVALLANLDGKCQIARTAPAGLATEDQENEGARHFRTWEERKRSLGHFRRSSAVAGTLPKLHAEDLFPSLRAMRRHLLRLVNTHGLECGHPSTKKLAKTAITAVDHTQRRGTLRAQPSRFTSTRPFKYATAGFTSLLVVSRVSGSSRAFVGLTNGSRRLLSGALGSRFEVDGTAPPVLKIGRKLLLICGASWRPPWLRTTGDCFGWGSALLYIGSRFSQIAKNHQRNSAEGLSLVMITCAIIANACMSVSILMRVNSVKEIVSKGPWILSSTGTVSLDIFLLLQAKHLNARRTKASRDAPEELSTPLLT